MSFKLPELSYGYSDLEPHIDARTMEIHHSKHHAGYTNNLNNAIKGTEFEHKPIEEILQSSNLSAAIRNNGGGYYNHCLFWEILSPDPKQSSSAFTELIEKTFGSCEAMKEQFAKAAATRFGSGWSWLCSKNGKLSICSTPNQDNPLMEIGCGGTPILGLDVWEHAYYLNYQNRRPDYITAFWNIVNWEKVEAKYQASL
jgi:Fe-Mn family superoxide dismutase